MADLGVLKTTRIESKAVVLRWINCLCLIAMSVCDSRLLSKGGLRKSSRLRKTIVVERQYPSFGYPPPRFWLVLGNCSSPTQGVLRGKRTGKNESCQNHYVANFKKPKCNKESLQKRQNASCERLLCFIK